MLAQVQKWGNSLAVRIPKRMAEEVPLVAGSQVRLSAENGKLVISPVTARKYCLKELLDQIDPDEVYGEVFDGPPAGNEAW